MQRKIKSLPVSLPSNHIIKQSIDKSDVPDDVRSLLISIRGDTRYFECVSEDLDYIYGYDKADGSFYRITTENIQQ